MFMCASLQMLKWSNLFKQPSGIRLFFVVMRKIFWVFSFLLALLGHLKAQPFSIFPQNGKPFIDRILLNQDSLRMPKLYRFGDLNGSFFERASGGEDKPLLAIKFASDSTYLDEGSLIPILLADYFGSDTARNIVWAISRADTSLKSLHWVQNALLDSGWRNIAWAEGFNSADTFAYFVLSDYLLPLPCNHESVYLIYEGPEKITLNIDGDAASGLTFEECMVFIQEHLDHLKAFHRSNCINEIPQITLEVAVRNADIAVIRAFMHDISTMGLRIELIFQWQP